MVSFCKFIYGTTLVVFVCICVVFSSPLQNAGRLKIVFNVIEQAAGDGRHCDRRGVCTGWLNDLTLPMLSHADSVENTLGKLALIDAKPVTVCLFYFLTVSSI